LSLLLPDASVPIALPNGWSADEAATVLTLVAPEGDIRVSFVAASKSAASADIAREAWKSVDAGFSLPVLNEADGPAAEGWDGTAQIAYSTPAAEGRSALAIVRTLGERAYVNLLWSSKAGLSRRMAQIGEIIKAWRPAGLAEVDLSGREPRPWSAQESSALAAFVRGALREAKIPGAAVAIVQDGAVVFAQGFGVTNIDAPGRVTAATRFMIGSTTKALTTLMMARMVESGRFAWSTPVTELLPGFTLADPDSTARLQLRHTVGAGTGMQRRDTDLIFRTKGVSAADRIAEMREMLPTTGFGETFQYSNYLVAAGGFAAAHAFDAQRSLEEAYEAAMRALVFQPLGMTRTTVPPRNGVDEDEAVPHALDFDGEPVAMDPAMERFADAVAPAGAAWSTASDIARYIALELAGAAAPEARREPQTRIDAKSSYGLGLFLSEEQGIATLGHGGNTLGFSSDMFFLPKKGIGVVVLTNLGAANACLAAVRQRIFELFFDAAETAQAIVAATAKAAAGILESKHARVGIDAATVEWLAQWTGDYRSTELGPARIERNPNGGYRVEFESWGSDLGVETQPDGGKLIVLTSPPWSGAFRLQPSASGDELIHDAAQTKYAFERV